MHENEISAVVLDCAIEVHRTLGGPGLLEGVYEEALAWELLHSGLHVQRKIEVPVKYKGNVPKTPLELDLLDNNLVIIECKSVAKHHEVFEA